MLNSYAHISILQPLIGRDQIPLYSNIQVIRVLLGFPALCCVAPLCLGRRNLEVRLIFPFVSFWFSAGGDALAMLIEREPGRDAAGDEVVSIDHS
jgi:hypothetical protein